MDDTRATDQMPQTIGRYQIQESVGFGAMGAVYKAFDPLIKRTLAIKTIRLDIPRQSPQYKSFIERFYHEARISGTLSHPNIVTLFDIGEEGGLPYLAMEYVEGETIASILDRGVKFKPERVIALVSQIASAVDYAHGKGVIHRDIKPSNLILFDSDKVKVTDFGIAKLADAEMTQSGTLLGTPSYMSPEQAMGEKIDGRSDIFSLGVCAFEMLSGEQPFPGSNVTGILYKLVHVEPIEPANLEMNGLVPQRWHEVFSRVLAKKPDDRYQSATEFVQDLEYCLGAWFGSAMGDETISESSAATVRVTGASAAAAAAAARAGAPTDATPPAPALPRSKRAESKTLPPVPLDADAATVHLKPVARLNVPAPPARPEPQPAGDTGTVVFKAPVAPPARAVAPAAAAPAPVPAAAPAAAPSGVEPTVVLKAPVPADVTMKSPAADVTMKSPAGVTLKASAAAVAPTIRTTAAALTPPATPRHAATPPRPPAASRPPAAARPAAAPPPKKGAPMGLILGGAGLVLLGVVAVAGVLAYKKFGGPAEAVQITPSAPPPATLVRRTPGPAAAAVGTIHVESQPPGATITIDGQPRGVTPADLADVPMGAHEVKVELKGYAPSSQNVLVSREAPRAELKLALSRSPAATGTAEIVSDPPGATVHIDGAPAGQTPYADSRLKAGTHRVEVTKEGFEPWSGSVTVQAGKKARVDARLRSIAVAATPVPVPVDRVDPNRIYVNSPAEVDVPARKISGASASYPTDRASRLRSGDSVSVRLNFVVTEAGEVTDLRVVESAGRVVDEAVLSAVRRWRYSPAVKQGTPVKVRVEFRQTFRAG